MFDSARNPLTLARYELKRLRGPLPRLAIVFILLIPLLYGCIYLSGNWDPYGRLNHVPVAVVNEDIPTTVGDRRVAAGEDFVASLHRAGTFDFRDTDARDAEEGLARGRYYLVITVPESFSADLVSGQGADPRRAAIMLRRNDANGFVIGTITNSAQNSIARAIDETAVRSYFEAVFANLATIREGMASASDGAAQLEAGLIQAREGSSRLHDGASQAATGADELATGASRLATGARTAKGGADDLAAGLERLDDGAGRLASGSAQVAAGTQQLADAVDPVLALAAVKLPDAQARLTEADAALLPELDALAAAHPELADDPAFQRLRGRVGDFSEAVADVGQRIGDLGAKARTAQDKVDALNDGAQQVAAGAADLHRGSTAAAGGARKLAQGLGDLRTGVDQLAGGASTLATGVHALAEGAASLDDGLGRLASGAHELSAGLADGVARLPVLTADEQADAAQVLAAPVDVTMTVDNPAHVYGRGLAPLFFSIALWVLGISAFMVVRPTTGRVIAGRASDLRTAFTAWLPIGGLSVVAGWLMLAASWLGLGLDPIHPVWMVVAVTAVALAFSAVAHLLRTALGFVATAALLVVLIIQLTSTGGTYPPELLPPFFASIGHLMPMTYTIDAFRIAISGGPLDRLVADLALMGVLFASSLGLLVAVIRRRRRFRPSDLRPGLG